MNDKTNEQLMQELVEARQRIAELEADIAKREEIATHMALERAVIMDSVGVGVTLLKDRKFLWVNKQMARTFGYADAELKGLPTAVLYPSVEEFEQLGRAAYPFLAKGERYQAEQRLKRKDGTLLWCNLIGMAINPSDLAQGAIWVVEDIAKQKQAEEDLRKWADIFEYAQWGIAVSDSDGKTIALVNPAFVRMYGYDTVEELIGKPIHELFVPESRAELPGQIGLAHEKGHHIFEAKHFRQDGTIFPVLLDVTAVKNKDGSFRYRVVNVQDITARITMEQEQERLRQEMIEAQQRVIQELSTPVIPVLEGIIIMPLIGSVDSMRAQDIMRTLLRGITQYRAQVVILDITGIPIVDTGVAAHLDKTIRAARLKGARVIVTGISESVAESVVDLGIDWGSIETLRDLQTGLTVALRSLGMNNSIDLRLK